MQTPIVLNGDFDARIWSIVAEELKISKRPIIGIHKTYDESGFDVIEVRKYKKKPQEGHLAEYEIIKEILFEDFFSEPIAKLKKVLARRCNRNKIFISSAAARTLRTLRP